MQEIIESLFFRALKLLENDIRTFKRKSSFVAIFRKAFSHFHASLEDINDYSSFSELVSAPYAYRI